MESLESKLDRLSPEQRRGVEDYVDFLLSRSAIPQPASPASVVPPAVPVIPPVMASAAPPVLSAPEIQPAPPSPPPAEPPEAAEPVLTEITAGGDDWTTRDYLDYGQFEEQPSSPATEAVQKVRRKLITKGEEEKPRQILDWID